MLQRLKSFISEHKLIDKLDQIGLAISGGKDSVCAAHILNELKIPFVLVHVNFCLRDEESETDQAFIEALATNLPFCKSIFIKTVDTLAYAKLHKVSIQEAARKIRYDYFDLLRKNGEFTKLITAHHKSDTLETFFINLYRKSGIKGLKGIPIKRDYIIRPFLTFSSDEILTYLNSKNIDYRNDSSNQDNKYLRNKVRNIILPVIRHELPDFEKRSSESIGYLQQESEAFDFLLADYIKQHVSFQKDKTLIPKNAILSFPQPSVFLYRFLDKYGFNPSQAKQIAVSCNGETGRLFLSPNYQLLVDRECLIVTPISKTKNYNISINKVGSYSFGNYTFILSPATEILFDSDPNSEVVRISPDMFPLTLRNWKNGDKFKPLGMTGEKLLSDFFIDKKIDIIKKHTIPLLCSNDKVIWVTGQRISDHIKASNNTHLFNISIIFDD